MRSDRIHDFYVHSVPLVRRLHSISFTAPRSLPGRAGPSARSIQVFPPRTQNVSIALLAYNATSLKKFFGTISSPFLSHSPFPRRSLWIGHEETRIENGMKMMIIIINNWKMYNV